MGLFAIIVNLVLMDWAQASMYRLGIPEGSREAAPYKRLIQSLDNKGFVVGENLHIVPISLTDLETQQGRVSTRTHIEKKTDLFFTTGDHLDIIFGLDIQTPLLFISTSNNTIDDIPNSMKDNTTGVYRGVVTSILEQSLRMLPVDQRKKLAVIYFNGSKVSMRLQKFISYFNQFGVELVTAEYQDANDIERVMRELHAKHVTAVLLFPPAARPNEIKEIVKWQNRLKIPVIGQLSRHINQGILGGPVIATDLISHQVATYAVKILQGRNPSQLPVKHFGSTYMINLASASKIGIKLPEDVINHAEIVGLAPLAKADKKECPPLHPGTFTLGFPSPLPSTATKTQLLDALSCRGYELNKNLQLIDIPVKKLKDPAKQQQLVTLIENQIDLLFSPGNVLPFLTNLPNFNKPVCFIATKETAAMIPDDAKLQYTGVIRASINSIIQMSQRMMQGAKKMAILSRKHATLNRLKGHYRTIAQQYGMTIDFHSFADLKDIGPLMRKMQHSVDFILLFPPSITDADVTEIVKWQNILGLPVLTQQKNHIKAGLLGGPVVNRNKTTPKLAEYIDKLLQGRSPEQLPVYYYPEKYVINLRATSILEQHIPEDITAEAEIIR